MRILYLMFGVHYGLFIFIGVHYPIMFGLSVCPFQDDDDGGQHGDQGRPFYPRNNPSRWGSTVEKLRVNSQGDWREVGCK